MKIDRALKCPKCQGTHFEVKREASYLYSYKLDTPITEHWSKEEEALPFLFDYRELVGDKQYLQCLECHNQYPCDLDLTQPHVQFTILQKAVRSDYVEQPDYLG